MSYIQQNSKKLLYCSFCGKSENEIKELIAGPSVYICNECVDLCIDIIFEKSGQQSPAIQKILAKAGKPAIDFESLNIKPRFGKLSFTIREKHCFYLGPFKDPFNAVYEEHVKPIALSTGLTIDRADEIYGTQPIIEDIWESINTAQLLVADVTGKNPNVMYEIGLAHTIGKPVIIMSQTIEDVPFDLRHYRCIIYDYTPRGIKRFEDQLRGTFNFVNNSPVSSKPS